MGNLPPRDVLAAASPEEVADQTRAILDSLPDTRRILMSCGGGVPPGVSSGNLRSFIQTVRTYKR